MKRMRMYDGTERTFEEGVEEYILDMKARNLRDGTINHYRQSTKQIYKFLFYLSHPKQAK